MYTIRGAVASRAYSINFRVRVRVGRNLVRPMEPPVRLVVILLSLHPSENAVIRLFVPCSCKQFIQAAESYTLVKGNV